MIRIPAIDVMGPLLLALALVFTTPIALGANDSGYRQTVDGVAVYFGIVPAEMVRGHPPDHPEGTMHGGAPVGDNHIMVGLFDAKTGQRITDAKVTARVRAEKLDVTKALDPMIVAGSKTFGNYFYMPGGGPYQIEVRIQRPGMAREIRATFTWARS